MLSAPCMRWSGCSATTSPRCAIARRLGIAAVDRIPRLKRAFARQAMGMGPGVTGLLAGQGLLKAR